MRVCALSAELFKAALCGVGCLGIITGVVLQCGPATALALRTSCTTLDDILSRGWSIASSAPYVRLEWVPYAGEPTAATIASQLQAEPCVFPINATESQTALLGADAVRVSRWDKTSSIYLDGDDEAVGSGWLGGWYKWARAWLRFVVDTAVAQWLLEAVFFAALFVPALLPIFARIFAWTVFVVPRTLSDRADRAVAVPRGRMARTVTSWAIAADRMTPALAGMRDLFNRAALNGKVMHFPITIEFAAADDIWLSPAFGQSVAIISIPAFRPLGATPQVQSVLAAVEDLMLSLGARPDWASQFSTPAAALRSLYPRWDHFAEMRAMLDPADMFINAWANRTIVEDGTHPEVDIGINTVAMLPAAFTDDTGPGALTKPSGQSSGSLAIAEPVRAESIRTPQGFGVHTALFTNGTDTDASATHLDADPAEATSPGGAWSRLAARAKAAGTP